MYVYAIVTIAIMGNCLSAPPTLICNSSNIESDQRGVFEEVELYLLQPSSFVIQFGIHFLNVAFPLIVC